MKVHVFVSSIFILLNMIVAQSYAAPTVEDINSIIKISKIDAHYSIMEEKRGVLEAVTKSLTGIDDEAAIGGAFEGVLDKHNMLERSRVYIGDRYDPALAKRAIETFSQELPAKMLSLEIEGSKPENKGKLKSFIQSIQEANIEHLIPLIAQVSSLSYTTDWMASFVEGMGTSFEPLLESMRKSGKISGDEKSKIVESLNTQASTYRESDPGLIFSLYIYKDISQKELQEYINLLESEEGQWFMQATRGAIVEGTRETMVDLAQKLVEKL